MLGCDAQYRQCWRIRVGMKTFSDRAQQARRRLAQFRTSAQKVGDRERSAHDVLRRFGF